MAIADVEERWREVEYGVKVEGCYGVRCVWLSRTDDDDEGSGRGALWWIGPRGVVELFKALAELGRVPNQFSRSRPCSRTLSASRSRGPASCRCDLNEISFPGPSPRFHLAVF